MKVTDIIEKYNPKTGDFEVFESDIMSEQNELEYPDLDKILNYLYQGALIDFWIGGWPRVGKMSCSYGNYSDGKWIWPSYVILILEQYPKYKLNESFVQDLRAKNYQFPNTNDLIEALKKMDLDDIKSVIEIINEGKRLKDLLNK